MSFAVSVPDGGLEWGSSSLSALFAQKMNALDPRFYRMLTDMRRFKTEVEAFLATPNWSTSVRNYITDMYRNDFIGNRFRRRCWASS